MAETFLYLTLGTNDLARAARFYDAALAPLGLVRRATEPAELGYGLPDDRRPRLWITLPFDGKPASIGNGVMVAFEARDQAQVDRLHAIALENGGTCEGAPGPRGDGFYAAYFRDPDGNKCNAFLMGQV